MAPEQSDLGFKAMTWLFRLRDLLRPRGPVLAEAGLKPGDRVLDFGCGPGGYVRAAARIVGPAGEIVALDVNRLAVKAVENLAFKHGLKNVRTVRSGLKTGLPDASVDAVLLYDVFHGLSRPPEVLEELARVLKPGGILSFSDHHLPDEQITASVTGAGLFRFVSRGKYVFTFAPQKAGAA
jgi:ubiquinone/menaquinone biosynthesis C-methylase UbiE